MSNTIPLAVQMRPQTIDDVLGQENLKQILKNLLKNQRLFSMIFYGLPGCGKTTIASVIVKEFQKPYEFLNATNNSKKDFEEVLNKARSNPGLILVVDEIHRMNKDKQDILLPVLEDGTVILIGLTSSNPYHKINPAIRSRCQIFKLEPLTEMEIENALLKAKKLLPKITLYANAAKKIASLANGDIRYAYSLLEFAYYASVNKRITESFISEIAPKANIQIDANDDGHYEVISALQKSIRGSDVNAALHYLARLLESGDFDIIYRRLSVIAYEDIGLANPSIGPMLEAAIAASERLGMPEARIPLGNIVTEMALSRKSNTSHIALDEALADIQSGNSGEVPEHLKGTSPNYKYPHDYPFNWVKQQYLPDNLLNKEYFRPRDYGRDGNLKKVYEALKKDSN